MVILPAPTAVAQLNFLDTWMDVVVEAAAAAALAAAVDEQQDAVVQAQAQETNLGCVVRGSPATCGGCEARDLHDAVAGAAASAVVVAVVEAKVEVEG